MVKKRKKKQTRQRNQKIIKKMTFKEVLKKYPEVTGVFFKHGMACVGCPLAQQETIEQGTLAHGLDVEKFIEELNKKVKNEKK